MKKTFLYALIASISISALAGIWVILSDDFSDLEVRVLLTTLTVAGASVCGLACGAFLESRGAENSSLAIVPVAGILAAVLSALLLLRLVWLPSYGEDAVFKLALGASIFAFALAHLSLLSMAKLAAGYKWSLVVAYVAILFLAFYLSFLLFAAPKSSDLLTFQLIGVAAVVDAAFSILIPVFHRLSRNDFRFVDKSTIEQLDAEIERLKLQLAELEQRKREILDLSDR